MNAIYQHPQFNNKIKSELNSAYAHLRIFASWFTQCVYRDRGVVECSLAGDLTAKPLTVSHFLSHVVLQSFRYVSHLLFHTACFLTCATHLLTHEFHQTTHPECTLSTPATLHACTHVNVNFRAHTAAFLTAWVSVALWLIQRAANTLQIHCTAQSLHPVLFCLCFSAKCVI